MRRTTSLLAALCLALSGLVASTALADEPEPAPATAEPASTESGYIPLPDGVELKYTALLPEGDGPFPVLLQYEGYYAGSDPTRAANLFVPRMLAKGYAVVGVSLRGSACSSGIWTLFDRQQAQDGAFAVDWIADRPWSNGKVAMYSYSYGGIMQAWVAAERPEHLVAITPANIVADTYRDIGFPGGIYNSVFPPEWGAALNGDWAFGVQRAPGDAKCAANASRHPVDAAPNQLAVQAPQHRFDDSWHERHSVVHLADRIDVPALVLQSWQDEETGGRGGHFFERMDPTKTWLVSTNGHHLMYQFSESVLRLLERFYDFHLKGLDNGFDDVPKVQVWHETTVADSSPRTVTGLDRLPVHVETAEVFLGPGGTMSKSPEAEGSTSYAYPVESPPVVDSSAVNQERENPANTWTELPYVPAGRGVFTSPPLAETVTTWGSASADLWVSTTAPDVDLQVTITEVRPDGQEMYVQRGWLRASHRALDDTRSTPVRPWHPHTAEAQAPMPAGTPQLLRVEVMPFGHTFRAGSSVRLYVEHPGVTGLWGFETVRTPQTVTVHAGPQHPSKLVLGLMPSASVAEDLPGCGAVHSQPCRTNPVPQPPGSLSLVSASSAPAGAADDGTGSTATGDRTAPAAAAPAGRALPATGAPTALPLVALALAGGAAALRRRRAAG